MVLMENTYKKIEETKYENIINYKNLFIFLYISIKSDVYYTNQKLMKYHI